MATKSPPAGKNKRIDRPNPRDVKPSEPAQRASTRSKSANQQRYPGLCRTCTHAPNCTFPRSGNRPLVFCDEFDGVVDIKPRHSVKSRPPKAPLPVLDRGRFRGLCLICEKRETCTFPKPEGGVFHCEEFE